MSLHVLNLPRVLKDVRIERLRPFDAMGKVSVELGQQVSWDTVVGAYASKEQIRRVRVESTGDSMLATVLVEPGQKVKRGEVLAYYSYLFGLGYTEYVSPCDGEILSVSPAIGSIFVKESFVDLKSNLPGTIVGVDDALGTWIESSGDFLGGVVGAAFGRSGTLEVKVKTGADQLQPGDIGPKDTHKVIVAGRSASRDLLEACVRHRVAGVVVGSIGRQVLEWYKGLAASLDLDEFLARYWVRDVKAEGLALLPTEIVPALIITEGYGDLPMGDGAFSLLREHRGEKTFIDGAQTWDQTPCVFVPAKDGKASPRKSAENLFPVKSGDKVRILGMARAVKEGTVEDISDGLVLENQVRAQGAVVLTSQGESLKIPFLNLIAAE